jgi:putative ABC transport system permease protein
MFYPADTYRYQFYDETLEAMYRQERQTAKLINLATAITILISCLGLFGLATLTAFQRTKEIGIRKVLGATVANIVALLSADFVKLVLIAILIATPVAWWAMSHWLEDFAYRVDIQWWMFAAAGLAAVMIALLTVSWQAVRAAGANPVESLRDE